MPQHTRRPSPMQASPPTPTSLTALTLRNIELIAQLEVAAAAKRSSADRVAKVLMAATWIQAVDWAESLVHVDLLRDQVKDSPEFDATAPVNRDYESRLYDYYGRPTYWS